MKGCPSAKKLSAYLDDEIDETRADRIRAHLRECPRCERCVREFLTLTEAVRQAGGRRPEPREWQSLWECLREEAAPSGPREIPRPRPLLTRAAFVAAAVLIAALIVLWPRLIDESSSGYIAATPSADEDWTVEEVEVYDDSTAVLMDWPDEGVSLVWFVSAEENGGTI